MGNIERTPVNYDAAMRALEASERLVSRFCKALGEPIPEDAIARSEQLQGAVEALREAHETLVQHIEEGAPQTGAYAVERQLTRALRAIGGR